MNTEKTRIFQLQQYQHPKDAGKLTEIMQSVWVSKMVEYIDKYHLEDICIYANRASYLSLNEDSAPELIGMLRRACEQFGLETIPELYLTREYEETVQYIGFSRPAILISAPYLEKLDDITLYGVLCGQAAGIIAQHPRTLFLLWVLENASTLLPSALVLAVKRLLNEWRRFRYLTYDRAFYLGTQDAQRALRNVLLPHIPSNLLDQFALGTENDQYLAQAQRFGADGIAGTVFQELNAAASDKSWLPVQYCELLSFVKGGQEK